MKSKSWLKLGSLAMTLGFLAACNSGLQTDAPNITEESSLATQATTVTKAVPNAVSDAEEQSTGSYYNNSTVLELGEKAPDDIQQTGLRFTGISIPKGATITSAKLEFVAVTSQSSTASLTIRGDKEANAPEFTSSNSRISARPRTTAVANWSPSAWTSGNAYSTADFRTVVQELVNQSSWASGNAMAFVITGSGQRKAQSYDGNSSKAAKLTVTYDLAPPSQKTCLDGTGTLIKFDQTYNVRKSVYDYGYNPVRVDARGGRFIRDVSAGHPAELFKAYNTRKLCLVGGTFKHVRNGTMAWKDWTPNRALWLENKPIATADRSKTATIVEGVAIPEAGDAFTIKDYTYNWQIKHSYIGRTHDDAIESDRITNGVVDDVLADATHVGISCQQEIARSDSRRNETVSVVIKNSMIALRDMDGSKHLYMFKMLRGGSPDPKTPNCQFTLQDNVFLITHATIGDGSSYYPFNPNNESAIKNANLPASKKPLNEAACVGHKNTIVYLGSNDSHFAKLQAESPTCFDVVRGSTFWNTKRNEWFDRHPEFNAYR